MKKFYIDGGGFLSGDIKISGSKNSVLSILSASLLSDDDIVISNIPKIKDVEVVFNIFKEIGVYLEIDYPICLIRSKYINITSLSHLSTLIRSSIFIAVSLLIKFGYSKTYFPGGCNFCNRPINFHLSIFKKFGIKVNIYDDSIIEMFLLNKLIGSKIYIDGISFGATVNAILLSVLADGISIIKNISLEPEIIDLINFLNSIGANINIFNKKLIIYGVKKLHSGKYKIMSDRLETSTFLLAGAISKKKICCYNADFNVLKSVINILVKSGSNIYFGNDYICLNTKKTIPVSFETSPYPGFPTDLQPIFTLLNLKNENKKITFITENIFSYRFSHVNELLKIGANLNIINNKIICTSVKKLFGNYLYAKDLRSSICLILSSIISENQTVVVDCNNYIDRGYENIIFKLNTLGMKIILSNV